MAELLSWSTANELGIALYEAHGETHPLEVSFVQLHGFVTALQGFEDDPKGSNEKLLEAIQMAWYDEWRVDNDG